MVKDRGNDNEEYKELAYDLRQVYAIEILGEHLKDVARARKEDNFPMYFKTLKDVWIVAQHRFRDKTYNVENEKGESVELNLKQYFNFLMNKVAKLANKYNTDWLAQTSDPDNIAKIESALNDVEMFLYDHIQEANIFGGKYDDEGL